MAETKTLPENYREWTTVDKSEWGPGPWNNEPDKVQWIDPDTGLDCLLHRNRGGAWCGYVGVGPEHPLHGVDYSADDTWGIEVHGGLTYADHCAETDDESHGICHIPAPGMPDPVWWFGFDCAHLYDRSPASDARLRAAGWRGMVEDDETYRDRSYVENEVRSLAKQLASR